MDSVEEDHSALVADPEDGVQHLVVPSQEATGAVGHLDSQAHGRPVPGQSGGMEISALNLTGRVGLLELGRHLLPGLPGLLAQLLSLRLPSTRPPRPVATRHTRPPALVTRSRRPQLQASLPQRLQVPVARLLSRLQVVLQQQLSWASSLCCDCVKLSRPTTKRMI